MLLHTWEALGSTSEFEPVTKAFIVSAEGRAFLRPKGESRRVKERLAWGLALIIRAKLSPNRIAQGLKLTYSRAHLWLWWVTRRRTIFSGCFITNFFDRSFRARIISLFVHLPETYDLFLSFGITGINSGALCDLCSQSGTMQNITYIHRSRNNLFRCQICLYFLHIHQIWIPHTVGRWNWRRIVSWQRSSDPSLLVNCKSEQLWEKWKRYFDWNVWIVCVG